MRSTPTFLFSDIEGSTQLWERVPAAMRSALERHDSIVRAAVERHDGHVFKTVGDAFCSVFPDATDAIGAALDAQRELASEDFGEIPSLLVRMAIHSGEAQLRDDDYFGPTVNRVARLMAIAHGAQVLLSGTTSDLAARPLPESAELRDLGLHRLRDLAGVERVYQLVAPGLRATFPALRSVDSFPNNLPRQLNPFVGRDTEERDVAMLMTESALVTLTGAGGIGKTRCALHAGAAVLDQTPDGVWLVELAALTDGSLIANAVAQALDLSETSGRPMTDVLLGYLKEKSMLLIFDNCEHLVEQSAAVASTILRHCRNVRILATSLQSLNVDGERIYRMPSLAVPPASALSPSQAQAYGAIALFEDRARAVDASFRLNDSNVADVVEICRRLDGIPLALQLAAARIPAFPPRELAKRLDERFRLLTGGNRTALPRQQTMRALIDWSYSLLDERERAMFRRLSIFAGGFTAASAIAVCSGEAVDEFDVLDVLSSLVDKSMVSTETETNGTMRYLLLESTRQYAAEASLQLGERENAAHAHALAFLALAERVEREIETLTDRDWYALVDPELENWRAALSWSLEGGNDPLLGMRLTGALHPLWATKFARDGQTWVPRALAAATPEMPNDVLAKLDLADAALQAALLHRPASLVAAQRALERYSALGEGDGFGAATARDYVGAALVLSGRIEEGEQTLQEALNGARRLGLRRLAGFTLLALGVARESAGDFDAARRFFAEALENFRSLDAERLIVAAALNLSETEFHAGNAERALELSKESLEAQRRWNDIDKCALTLTNITAYLILLGRYGEARESAREAIELASAENFETLIVWAVQHLAAIAAFEPATNDDLERAARLLGYVDARATALSYARGYTEQQEYDAVSRLLENALGETALSQYAAEGSHWDDTRAVREASR